MRTVDVYKVIKLHKVLQTLFQSCPFALALLAMLVGHWVSFLGDFFRGNLKKNEKKMKKKIEKKN